VGFIWLADLVLLAHLAFVVFAVLGGLLVLRRPRIAWLHLPCSAWAAFVEFAGIVCPLTPLENRLRWLGGEPGYSGDFVGHYVTAVLYPAGLTRGLQIAIGSFVVALNVAVYWRAVARKLASRRTSRQIARVHRAP
jgi:hypothetical protein